jgi:hypothetical protein
MSWAAGKTEKNASRQLAFLGLRLQEPSVQPTAAAGSMTVRPNRPMKPIVKQNKEFAKWFRDWIEVIQQNRAAVERIRPEKTASVDGEEHSDCASVPGPKRRVASGRNVA